MKTVIFKTLFLVIILGFISCEDSKSLISKRPNIIFIMADDHASRTISAYGNGLNHTPNIDRIANEGALFINSFNANSVCQPSRATILTGKHSHKNGVTSNYASWNREQTLLPKILQENGYKTALIGKWHLNADPGNEFDFWKVLSGDGKQGFYYNPDFITSEGEVLTEEGFSTDIITNDALDWLDNNQKSGGDPFTLFVHYKATHVPRMPHFRYLDKYKNDTISEPKTLFDDYSTRERYAKEAWMMVGHNYKPLPLLKNHNIKDKYFARMTKDQLEKWHSYKDPENKNFFKLKKNGKLKGENLKKYAYQQFIKDYLRCVDGIDDNVGRILSWLDNNEELKENTIVVYASDQDYFTGEHGYAEKRFMYEEGMKMPLMMRYPKKINPGLKVAEMIQNIDYAPTFLEAARIPIPIDMQGASFLNILTNQAAEASSNWRDAVYYHYYEHGIHNVPRHDGVRTKKYKLIHFYTENTFEFYDLEADPNEIRNLYKNVNYNQIIENLKEELKRLRKEYEVPETYFNPPYVKVN